MAEERADPPDEVLVVAAIVGDLAAFDELASRYRAAVVRTADSIVGRDDAEDVAQEAILLAFKALPSIEDPARFGAWLSTITRHRAFRFLKRGRSESQCRIDLDEVLLEQFGALAKPLVGQKEEDEELKLALERLPADYALVLRLRFLDEMPLKRIASFLGTSLATAKWRLHRGKQLLRQEVELLRSRG